MYWCTHRGVLQKQCVVHFWSAIKPFDLMIQLKQPHTPHCPAPMRNLHTHSTLFQTKVLSHVPCHTPRISEMCCTPRTAREVLLSSNPRSSSFSTLLCLPSPSCSFSTRFSFPFNPLLCLSASTTSPVRHPLASAPTSHFSYTVTPFPLTLGYLVPVCIQQWVCSQANVTFVL